MLSPARWSLFRLSKQYTALALAALGHDVLYVDPPVSIGSVVRDRDRLRDLRGPRSVSPAPNLRVWRPIVAPGQNTRAGQRFNARLLERGIARQLPRLELTVAFSLEARGVLRRLGGRRVYYCTDSFEDLPGADADAVRHQEREICATADVVVACSIPLRDQLAARGVPAVYLSHATDSDALAQPQAVPAEIAALPRPIVAYLGSLNFRIDRDLLDSARRAAGEGTLLIIGEEYGPSLAPDVAALLRQPRVVAIGNRPGDQLGTYLSGVDVGLVPYSGAAFNRKSFPIKVLQYLAAGVPVVSSANGATDELGAIVAVADDPDAFQVAVEYAIAHDTDAARTRRREAAASRRWEDNASRLLDAAGVAS